MFSRPCSIQRYLLGLCAFPSKWNAQCFESQISTSSSGLLLLTALMLDDTALGSPAALRVFDSKYIFPWIGISLFVSCLLSLPSLSMSLEARGFVSQLLVVLTAAILVDKCPRMIILFRGFTLIPNLALCKNGIGHKANMERVKQLILTPCGERTFLYARS